MIAPSTTALAAERPNPELKRTLDLVERPRETHDVCQKYLKTTEAARYLHRSVSWLLRCGAIPYVPDRPNLYSIHDLDDWFESHKHIPRS